MKKNSPAKNVGIMEMLTGRGGSGNSTMGMPPHNSSRSNSLQDKHIARKNPSGPIRNYNKGYKTPGA